MHIHKPNNTCTREMYALCRHAYVINEHFLWNVPRVQNVHQDLTPWLRSLTNASRGNVTLYMQFKKLLDICAKSIRPKRHGFQVIHLVRFFLRMLHILYYIILYYIILYYILTSGNKCETCFLFQWLSVSIQRFKSVALSLSFEIPAAMDS